MSVSFAVGQLKLWDALCLKEGKKLYQNVGLEKTYTFFDSGIYEQVVHLHCILFSIGMQVQTRRILQHPTVKTHTQVVKYMTKSIPCSRTPEQLKLSCLL
jgi:hypothetical protein